MGSAPTGVRRPLSLTVALGWGCSSEVVRACRKIATYTGKAVERVAHESNRDYWMSATGAKRLRRHRTDPRPDRSRSMSRPGERGDQSHRGILRLNRSRKCMMDGTPAEKEDEATTIAM